MTFLQPPEVPRILTLQVVEAVGKIQHWEEGHSLMIWLIGQIILLELAIRNHLLEGAQLLLEWQHQFPQWRTQEKLRHPQVSLQRKTELVLWDQLIET